jgi:hypothetical protein
VGLACAQAVAAEERHLGEVGKLHKQLQEQEAAFEKGLRVSVCACSLSCMQLFVACHGSHACSCSASCPPARL